MLVLPPGRSGRSPSQLLFVLDPSVGVIVGGVDQLGDDLQIGLYDKDGTCVFMFPAVVCC